MSPIMEDRFYKNNFKAEQGTAEYEKARLTIANNFNTFVHSLRRSYDEYPVDQNEFREKILSVQDFRHFSFLPNCFRIRVLSSVFGGFSFDEFVSDPEWSLSALERMSKCLSREGKHVLAGMAIDILFDILIKIVQEEEYMDPQAYKKSLRSLEPGMKKNLKTRGYWPDNKFNQFRRYFDQVFDEFDPAVDSRDGFLFINNLAADYFGSEFQKPISFLHRFISDVVYEDETFEIGREYRLQCYFYPFEDEDTL